MGYFEDLDTKNMNWNTDGKIRIIDGGARLVPHIDNGIESDIYKGVIADVLALDWKHYKLYLLGGV